MDCGVEQIWEKVSYQLSVGSSRKKMSEEQIWGYIVSQAFSFGYFLSNYILQFCTNITTDLEEHL